MLLENFFGRIFLLTYLIIHLIILLVPYGYKIGQLRKMILYLSIGVSIYAGLGFTWAMLFELEIKPYILIMVMLVSGILFYFVVSNVVSFAESNPYKVITIKRWPGNPKIIGLVCAILYFLVLGWIMVNGLYKPLEVDVEWVPVGVLSLVGAMVFYYFVESMYRESQLWAEKFNQKKE